MFKTKIMCRTTSDFPPSCPTFVALTWQWVPWSHICFLQLPVRSLAPGALGLGSVPTSDPGFSLDLGRADPSPLPLWKTWRRIILNYLVRLLGRRGLNEYLQSTLRPLNERSYKNARCYFLFMKVLWVLANSMNCWHLIIETVCLSDPLW